MNQSESKPLQRELARSPVSGPHSDFDILAALAEGKLSPREREEVFAHLATCAECREVLAVATEAAPPIPESESKPFLMPRSKHRLPRQWLPWASIAAGIVVACSAGLLYKQKLDLKPRAAVAGESTPAIPTADARQNEFSKSAEPTVGLGKTPSPSTPPKLKAPTLAKESRDQWPASQAGAGSAMPLDLRRQDARIESSSAAVAGREGVLARPSPPAPASSAFAGAEPRAMDKASVAAVARPHWRINTIGQPERAFGDEEWKVVLPDEEARMRVISVYSADVWIGGENTRLYHSVDNGSSWSLVVLPQKGDSEHAIAHIRFQTSKAGIVEAADGVTWTTNDGGISWN